MKKVNREEERDAMLASLINKKAEYYRLAYVYLGDSALSLEAID